MCLRLQIETLSMYTVFSEVAAGYQRRRVALDQQLPREDDCHASLVARLPNDLDRIVR
jgi:hypothetical protein